MTHAPAFARSTWFASLVCGLALSSSAWAQSNTSNAAPAAPAAQAAADTALPAQPKLPPPDPAAEKAVQGYIKALISALNGQGPVLSAASFSEEFNQKITGEQLRQVFTQLHQNLGDCRLVGQVKIPVSFVGSYLLDCSKGYVPVDLAVEDKAPYRIHSLLIRPDYSKP